MKVQLSPPEDTVSHQERQQWRVALRTDFWLAVHSMPSAVRHALEDEIKDILAQERRVVLFVD